MRAKIREYQLFRRFFSEEVTLEQVLSSETYTRQQVKERGQTVVEEGRVCSQAQRNGSFNSRQKSTTFIATD